MSESTQDNAGGKSTKDSASRSDNADDTAPNEHQTKLLDEVKKERNKRRAAETELETLRAEKAERERLELEAKGKYDEAQKKIKEELDKTKTQLNVLQEERLNLRKLGAVLKHVNVDPKFHDLVPYDKVVVDENGEIDLASAQKIAEGFKKEYPETLRSTKPGMTEKAPGGAQTRGGKIAYSEWCKLDHIEMKKYKMADIDLDS